MIRLLKNRRGSALVEYSLIVAGVALVAAAAVSIFGHKTNDLIAATATILPGAHADDNAPIGSGKIVETTFDDTTGAIRIGVEDIVAASEQSRLGNNLLGIPGGEGSAADGFAGLVLEY